MDNWEDILNNSIGKRVKLIINLSSYTGKITDVKSNEVYMEDVFVQYEFTRKKETKFLGHGSFPLTMIEAIVFGINKEEVVPNNNDGRDTCYFCGAPTKKVWGFVNNQYDICSVCGK